jgi:hypothetical protein
MRTYGLVSYELHGREWPRTLSTATLKEMSTTITRVLPLDDLGWADVLHRRCVLNMKEVRLTFVPRMSVTFPSVSPRSLLR